MLAAYLLAQLEVRDKIQAKRQEIWEYYQEKLADWAKQQGIQIPFIPDYCEQTYHMFYLLLPSLEVRQKLIAHLRAKGIPECISLLTPEFIGHGPKVWRQGRRLPCD